MRLLVLSDLHIETWRDDGPDCNLLQSRPDVVILAGDIHTGRDAIAWATRKFPDLPVVYVYGNHEIYGFNFEDFEIDIARSSRAPRNFHFLDAGEFIFCGVRFLGATLWTDFCLLGDSLAKKNMAMHDAQQKMKDYQLIRLVSSPIGRLCPRDTLAMHAEQRTWLAERLSIPFEGKTVVVTHMAPSVKSISAAYPEESLAPAYASRLDSFVAKADLWVHGHVHASADYEIGKCRVVCNPRGYPTQSGAQNRAFDANFVVEI